jgi:hypothetical protein
MTTVIHSTRSIVHVDDADEAPDGVHHIEVFTKSMQSIGYWTVDEVREDPVGVLGAIFGAISSGKPANQAEGGST